MFSENYSKHSSDSANISLIEVCHMLSITETTGRNWIKLGKIIPNEDGKTFDKEYISRLIADIQTGDTAILKKRRNKKQIRGSAIYNSYIDNNENYETVRKITGSLIDNNTLSNRQLCLVLANYAIQLFLQKIGEPIHYDNLLKEFYEKKLDLGIYSILIEDLLTDNSFSINPWHEQDGNQIEELLKYNLEYNKGEDTLGLLYISLQDMTERKNSGAYYTPINTVKSLISSLSQKTNLANKKILDPCCGTGNFLINLTEQARDPELLFGQDVDDVSVKISRINVALSYEISDTGFLYKNIVCCDTILEAGLSDILEDGFDIILGNPPWGLDFSNYDMAILKEKYLSASDWGTESYDLFIEKALLMLKKNGILAFVLPEAVLNVKMHKPVRDVILTNCSFEFVSFIGNAFMGVTCPSIILCLKLANPGRTSGCTINNNRNKSIHKNFPNNFIIKSERNFTGEGFVLNVPDTHYNCLKAISEVAGNEKKYLADNAKFALGIVTGDNKKLLSSEQHDGYERIILGSDLMKYQILASSNYIKYEPKNFQQVAKTELYRTSEKLLYRFICNTPVFAYDSDQRISLNSCNILIPQISGLDMKYVMAILNSRVVAYFFKMKFNSVKLLKSHIEQIPIPVADKNEQELIISNVDEMINSKSSISEKYEETEIMIMDLFGLSDCHQNLINETIKSEPEYFQK